VIDALAAWLDSPALVLAGAPASWAEMLGAVAGVACVALVARKSILNWPVGLLNNVFWAWLFLRAKLYGDSALQGIFFVLGCWGWWRWATSGRKDGPAEVRPVRRIRLAEWKVLAALVGVSTAALAIFLARATDSPAPLADASVVTLSLAATWCQAEKVLESWWLWIVVDVISVPLYASRALYPTAGVYVIFGGLCVIGLRAWSRDLARQARA
jgi:nicotinamide mononucleotide transporter